MNLLRVIGCDGGAFPASRVLVAAMLLAASTGSSFAAIPFRAATPTERQMRAAVVRADYRYGDLLWENDCTAHRIYGRPLEAAEPPSGSGIDAWGKAVPWPFMDRQLKTGDQHAEHGEGVDFYNVGTSRGAGGLGIWRDNKLWTSRNYARAEIHSAGPTLADFTVTYDPWPIGIDRSVRERRRMTLQPGTPFTRVVSTISASRAGELVVAIGLAKRATDPARAGTFEAVPARGRFRWWGPDLPAHGAMGTALLVDPAMVAGVTADNENHLVLLRVKPGRPFVYYLGATWSRGRCATTPAAWARAVDSFSPDFRARND